MSQNIQPRQVYNANCAGVVGGHSGPMGPIEARLRQQEELDRKAAAHAVKLKQKEEEKRQKRIERWEFMNGMGPGHFVGGSENDVIPFLEQGEQRAMMKQKSMEVARQRMQHKHNAETARASSDLRNFSATTEQNADKKSKEREEAKRLKKIADWERMNGICASGKGHILGGGNLCGGNPSMLHGESSRVMRQMAFPLASQMQQEGQGGGSSAAGALTCQAAKFPINLNQKAKEQQNQPPLAPLPITPSKKLAANFSKLDFKSFE